jgi:hypothetical protein
VSELPEGVRVDTAGHEDTEDGFSGKYFLNAGPGDFEVLSGSQHVVTRTYRQNRQVEFARG